MQEHLKFALKVAVALIILNVILDFTGLRRFVYNPLQALGIGVTPPPA